jgi:hypothetical protein
MKSQWLPYAILRTASLLAPGDQRAEWLDGWHSELWYIPRRGATRFCLGAFPDALWLRRNNLSPVKQTGIRLESPLACLAFLATLAAVSLLIAARLPAPDTMTRSPHLGFLNLLEGCIAMLMISVLICSRISRRNCIPNGRRSPLPWCGRSGFVNTSPTAWRSKWKIRGMTLTFERRLTFSADEKELHVTERIAGPEGEIENSCRLPVR